MREINIGLIGFGVVGTGVLSILQEKAEIIKQRRGLDLRIKKIACRDISKKRDIEIENDLLTTNIDEIILDPDIDIVVELIGGDIDFAYTLLSKAIQNKKHIVSANKSLLALRGRELFELANKYKLEIGFEASVGGGIPIIQTIRNALVGDKIKSLYGIINGTCNYILTKMSTLNDSYASALKKAQDLGFAEASPTLDVNGMDSAHKIAILSSFAFNTDITKSFYYEGIEDIDPIDIGYARELGYIIKLLGIAKETKEGIEVNVHPTLVSLDNPLAGIKNEYNAILINSKFLGKSIYSGKGAGRYPTANAVVGDITDIAEHIAYSVNFNTYKNIHYEKKAIIPIEKSLYHYYIRFNTLDKSGMLAQITTVFAKHNISIAQIIQKGRHKKDFVHLIFCTHTAKEQDIRNALAELDPLNIIDRPTKLIRIIKE